MANQTFWDLPPKTILTGIGLMAVFLVSWHVTCIAGMAGPIRSIGLKSPTPLSTAPSSVCSLHL